MWAQDHFSPSVAQGCHQRGHPWLEYIDNNLLQVNRDVQSNPSIYKMNLQSFDMIEHVFVAGPTVCPALG